MITALSKRNNKMEIAIGTNQKDGTIATVKNFEDVHTKGEVAHFLAELEIIKQELLEIWVKVQDWDE